MLKNQQRPINRRGDKSLLYIRTSTCHTVTWRDIITCHSLCCPAWVQIQARLSVLAELLMYSVSLTLVLQYSSFLLNYWCCGPLDVVACVPHVSRNGIIGAGFPLYHSVVSMQHRRPSTASLSFRCKLSHTHTQGIWYAAVPFHSPRAVGVVTWVMRTFDLIRVVEDLNI